MNRSDFSISGNYSKVDDICKLKWYLSTFQVENLNFVDENRTQIFRISQSDQVQNPPLSNHFQNLILVYTSLSETEIHKFLSTVVKYPRELKIMDFDIATFIHQLKRSSEQNTEIEDEIFIRENGWLKKVLINNINWIKVEGVYTHLACKEGLHTLRNTAKCVLKKLPRGLFYQIHKCYYVNRNKVEAFNSHSVKIGENILPIGRTFHKTILQEIAHLG